ncbi:CERS5_6 [Acanthosepion pharaonis]|uniref:CERS5_6 n=1 Tax=Acanthosepion pharaonis TaxID=158019 RepID=A0A812E850_ACAPH|nr:CERS5_6 [Sepia pharaonis]
MDALTLWKDIKATFWSEKFWFPKNLTWESLENKDDGIYHPQLNDLYLVLPIAVFLSLFRIFLERYVFCPLGKNLGLKEEKYTRAIYYKALENAYRLNKRPCNGLVQGLAKQTDLSIRQVERWFRIRRNQDKASVLKKFAESGWRCTFYSTIFTYGIVMLFDDFWELFIHHIITILLLTFSWIQNMIRIGTLVLVIHDTIDPIVETEDLRSETEEEVSDEKSLPSLISVFNIRSNAFSLSLLLHIRGTFLIF